LDGEPHLELVRRGREPYRGLVLLVKLSQGHDFGLQLDIRTGVSRKV
jgi:hypothetical protein